MRWSVLFLILFFAVFFNILQGPIICHLFFSNLHMNNLSKDIVSTIKQFVDNVLLSLITLNAKTLSLWIKLIFEKQIWMNTMLFINLDLNKQALVVKISRTTKSYHTQTCFSNILRIYLNEKLNFYHHILVGNAQIYIRLENLVH